MTTYREASDAFIASKKECDRATLGRCQFWVERLGDRELDAITTDDIDEGMMALVKRGKLKAGTNTRTRKTGLPLAGSTQNRYLGQVGSIYKYAKKARLLKRGFVSPTIGIGREPEPADPDRYLKPEEVAKLVALARVMDKRWKKMAALIIVAFHTGMRVGNLVKLKGKYVDLKAGTITALTKNGDTITCALSDDALAELKKLPKCQPEELIFGNRWGKHFRYTPMFRLIATAAGMPNVTFHWLRHGHGYMLARAGTSQQMIMKSMGHRTLTASARYAHASIDDKRAVIANVFNRPQGSPPPQPSQPRGKLSLVRAA